MEASNKEMEHLWNLNLKEASKGVGQMNKQFIQKVVDCLTKKKNNGSLHQIFQNHPMGYDIQNDDEVWQGNALHTTDQDISPLTFGSGPGHHGKVW